MKKFWKQFTDSKIYKPVLIILGIIFIFLVWLIASLIINKSLFPTPFKTFATLFDMLGQPMTWLAIGGSFYRLLIAFALSFVFALVLGIFGGFFPSFKTFFNPVVVLLRTIPTAAVVVILVVLLKPHAGLYIIDFLLMFPILYEAVVSGITNIPSSVWGALKLDGGTKNWNAIRYVIVPMAFPYVSLGIIQTLGLGMKISIMSEILIGATNSNEIQGLGFLLRDAQAYNDMKTVFAIALIAIFIIGLLDVLVKVLKNKFFQK